MADYRGIIEALENVFASHNPSSTLLVDIFQYLVGLGDCISKKQGIIDFVRWFFIFSSLRENRKFNRDEYNSRRPVALC